MVKINLLPIKMKYKNYIEESLKEK